MFTLRNAEDDPDILELHARGTLTDPDYQRLMPELAAALPSGTRRRILVVLEDFHGWQPAALLDELKFDLKYRDRIGPVAIVGTHAWERWGAWLANLLFASEVRPFSTREAALAWLKAHAAPAAARG